MAMREAPDIPPRIDPLLPDLESEEQKKDGELVVQAMIDEKNRVFKEVLEPTSEDAAAEEECSVGGGGNGGEIAEELRPANETGGEGLSLVEAVPLPTMALPLREVGTSQRRRGGEGEENGAAAVREVSGGSP